MSAVDRARSALALAPALGVILAVCIPLGYLASIDPLFGWLLVALFGGAGIGVMYATRSERRPDPVDDAEADAENERWERDFWGDDR